MICSVHCISIIILYYSVVILYYLWSGAESEHQE